MRTDLWLKYPDLVQFLMSGPHYYDCGEYVECTGCRGNGYPDDHEATCKLVEAWFRLEMKDDLNWVIEACHEEALKLNKRYDRERCSFYETGVCHCWESE